MSFARYRGHWVVGLFAIAASVVLPPGASALEEPIPPTEIARSDRLDAVSSAMAPDGTTVAAANTAAFFPPVIAGFRPAHGEFQPFEPLTGTRFLNDPVVAVGPERQFGVTWTQFVTGGLPLEVVDAAAGDFGSTDVSTNVNTRATTVDLAYLPNGRQLFISNQTNAAGDANRISALTRDPAQGFVLSAVTATLTDTSTDSQPDVEVASSGEATVSAWERRIAAGMHQIQADVDPLGAPSPVTVASSAVADEILQLDDLQVDRDGNAILLLSRFTPSPGGIATEVAVRPAGGDWTPSTVLRQGVAGAKVAFADNGDALVVWSQFSGGTSRLQGRLRPAGGAFGPVLALGEDPGGHIAQVVGFDAAGNAVIAYAGTVNGTRVARAVVREANGTVRQARTLGGPLANNPPAVNLHVAPDGNTLILWRGTVPSSTAPGGVANTIVLSGLDNGDPPQIGPVAGPATAVIGGEIALGVNPTDFFGIRSITWDFGDGTSASGPSVAHTFQTPGARTVTVTVIDEAGIAATATKAINVVAPAGPPLPPIVIQPEAPAPPGATPPTGSPSLLTDRTAPTARLRVPRTIRRRVLLRRGLTVTITPSERSRIEADLLGTVNRARLSARFNLVLASRTVSGVTRARRITLKPSRRLLGGRRRITTQLRLGLTDAAGNRRVVRRTIRVR